MQAQHNFVGMRQDVHEGSSPGAAMNSVKMAAYFADNRQDCINTHRHMRMMCSSDELTE